MSRLPERIARRIVPDEAGCWIWSGSKTTAGYGNLRLDGRYTYAHRLVYESLVAPIPDGLTIDHLCRVRACCNPAHLEPVTAAENIRRAAAVKTACPLGHAYDDENTYRSPRGERRCRTCARQYDRRRRGYAA